MTDHEATESSSVIAALERVAEAAGELVIDWGNYASRDPKLTAREDELIDALTKLSEARRG